MKEIPYHILYAINNEEKCIELRKNQIKEYRKRIKLLKSGKKMGEINEKVPPVKANFKYSVKYYWRLKNEWESKNSDVV